MQLPLSKERALRFDRACSFMGKVNDRRKFSWWRLFFCVMIYMLYVLYLSAHRGVGSCSRITWNWLGK